MSSKTYFLDLTEARIDFVGQALVEKISQFWLIATTIVAFLVGWVLQSLAVTFAVFGVSTAILAVVVLPAWPLYNAHPVQWLPEEKTTNSRVVS